MTDYRLIAALDHSNIIESQALADQLGDRVGFYKIGLGSLTTGGLSLAIELKEQGKKIFLDMKLFDIGATVERAVRGLCQFELDFLTVHGDPQVVTAAKVGASGRDTKILAVTLLTSLNRTDLDANLIKAGDITELVTERAVNAFAAGADGVIASPHEAAMIRALPESAGKLIVVPGIRPAGSASDDQKRIMTPRDAIDAGADHLVIGRPIYAALDPVAATEAILSAI